MKIKWQSPGAFYFGCEFGDRKYGFLMVLYFFPFELWVS